MSSAETTTLQPLAKVPTTPWLARLPKADLHVHQEELPRLERVLARQQGRAPYDWRSWAQHLLESVPPGMARLDAMAAPDTTLALDGVRANDPDLVIARIADLLEEAAADGAIFVEVRFGATGRARMRSDLLTLFREAERPVQSRYPPLRSEAVGFLLLASDPVRLQRAEENVNIYLQLAREGLMGLDFVLLPYETEVDPALWAVGYRWAARAVDAGLGITVHAGEFSTANLAAALQVPGLSRLGHAVYAATDQRLLDQLAQRAIMVECCLSCNVVLGAVPSYEAHPIRQFSAAGVRVTLNTDDPVRIATTIGREYAVASALGFSASELVGFTHNAIQAASTTDARKYELVQYLNDWGRP